ncbi:hypothetical protein B484DRAFT_301315, partial [Ochromonadaceae sp. CCMP2298]
PPLTLSQRYYGKDIDLYLRALEQTVITAAAQFGITADRMQKPGYTGVWVGEHKVAALGVKISRWVTLHGVAVNVSPDMRYFDNIVPCGIRDKPVGALSQF